VGAETHTAPTSSAAGTPTVPTPAQHETGPISWTTGPARTARVRAKRPEPRLRQLMGVCGWAAVLGGVGLVIGIRGFIGVLADEPPTWYEPSMMAVGVIGIALTVGAFLTVQFRTTPWIMLSSSSIALIVAMSLTANAF